MATASPKGRRSRKREAGQFREWAPDGVRCRCCVGVQYHPAHLVKNGVCHECRLEQFHDPANRDRLAETTPTPALWWMMDATTPGYRMVRDAPRYAPGELVQTVVSVDTPPRTWADAVSAAGADQCEDGSLFGQMMQGMGVSVSTAHNPGFSGMDRRGGRWQHEVRLAPPIETPYDPADWSDSQTADLLREWTPRQIEAAYVAGDINSDIRDMAMKRRKALEDWKHRRGIENVDPPAHVDVDKPRMVCAECGIDHAVRHPSGKCLPCRLAADPNRNPDNPMMFTLDRKPTKRGRPIHTHDGFGPPPADWLTRKY